MPTTDDDHRLQPAPYGGEPPILYTVRTELERDPSGKGLLAKNPFNALVDVYKAGGPVWLAVRELLVQFRVLRGITAFLRMASDADQRGGAAAPSAGTVQVRLLLALDPVAKNVVAEECRDRARMAELACAEIRNDEEGDPTDTENFYRGRAHAYRELADVLDPREAAPSLSENIRHQLEGLDPDEVREHYASLHVPGEAVDEDPRTKAGWEAFRTSMQSAATLQAQRHGYRVMVREGVTIYGVARLPGTVLAEGLGDVPIGNAGSSCRDGLVDDGWVVVTGHGTCEVVPRACIEIVGFERLHPKSTPGLDNPGTGSGPGSGGVLLAGWATGAGGEATVTPGDRKLADLDGMGAALAEQVQRIAERFGHFETEMKAEIKAHLERFAGLTDEIAYLRRCVSASGSIPFGGSGPQGG